MTGVTAGCFKLGTCCPKIHKEVKNCPSEDSQNIMRALVTGAAGTFGVHITAGLIRAGYETLAVVRSAERGTELAGKLAALGVSTALLTCVAADLGTAPSISAALRTALAGRPLDILVNNAAAVSDVRATVADGVELQWATSVLSYQRVLRAALPALLAAPAPRVVFVASEYAGDLDVSDPEFKRRAYDANAAYKASKQANRMLAKAWAVRQPLLAVYSCHPGIADSSVARGLGFSFSDAEAAARKGAVTPLYCALQPRASLAPSGAFYSDSKPAPCRFSADAVAVDELWQLVEAYA